MGNKQYAVINANGTVDDKIIEFQIADDVGLLWSCLVAYFNRAVLGDKDITTGNKKKLQEALNAKAKDVSELAIEKDSGERVYLFDDDQRAIELAVMIAIYETTRLIGQSNNNIIRPGWQKANQKVLMKGHTGKESWDGFFFGRENGDSSGMIPMPFELKSLMNNPNIPELGDPNEQLAAKIHDYSQHFQAEGSICAVLMMPYTDRAKLAVDVKRAASDMKSVASPKTLNAVCLLSFPLDKAGKMNMSILCMMVPGDIESITLDRVESLMREINFGKSA